MEAKDEYGCRKINDEEGWCDGYDKGFKVGYVEGFNGAEATMIPRATEDGRLAGIKEVVKGLNKLAEEFEVSTFRDVIKSPLWQFKLRELGVKNESNNH